jgi:hypothetical protein
MPIPLTPVTAGDALNRAGHLATRHRLPDVEPAP